MNPKRLAATIVQEWLESSPFGDYDDLERLLAKQLKPLLEPWIPVTERLPNDAQKVLAVFRPGEQPLIVYLDKHVGKWADDPETGYYVEWPKYWMPLPKAPER
ncbi:MAG TPA: DUF551 domain-containing protein [Herpetosiphonaceae bacterium]